MMVRYQQFTISTNKEMFQAPNQRKVAFKKHQHSTKKSPSVTKKLSFSSAPKSMI